MFGKKSRCEAHTCRRGQIIGFSIKEDADARRKSPSKWEVEVYSSATEQTPAMDIVVHVVMDDLIDRLAIGDTVDMIGDFSDWSSMKVQTMHNVTRDINVFDYSGAQRPGSWFGSLFSFRSSHSQNYGWASTGFTNTSSGSGHTPTRTGF